MTNIAVLKRNYNVFETTKDNRKGSPGRYKNINNGSYNTQLEKNTHTAKRPLALGHSQEQTERHTMREGERERDRQTDRQTDRDRE